jgi:hypothetical protein
MCVSPQVLVSGLLLRIERDGYVATQRDFVALMGLRFTREELRATLVARAARCPTAPFAEAIAVLEACPTPTLAARVPSR